MALASFLTATIGKSILGGVMSAAASRLLKPKVTNPRIDFKGMRDDAEAAGFNPLTALRSGAASGYMIPALSKQSFVGQFLSGSIRAGTDAFLNKDIDAYNKEIRQLNLKERKLNIGLMSKQLAAMSASVNTQMPSSVLGAGIQPNVTKSALLTSSWGDLSTNQNNEVTDAEVKPVLKSYSSSRGNTFSSILNNDEFLESAALAGQSVLVDTATKLGIYGPKQRAAMNEIIFGKLNRKMNNFLGYD